jgi:hypothetical protein
MPFAGNPARLLYMRRHPGYPRKTAPVARIGRRGGDNRMRVFRGLALTAAVLSTFALAAPVYAQSNASHEDNGIGIGVEGMITRSSIHADNVGDLFKSKTGSGFGLWVGGNKNGLIGFTGEFIYLTRNVEANGQELKSRALEIPAVFHINVGSRSRNGISGYGLVGPVFTINLKQTLDDVDVSDNFNGADIGIMGGAGIEIYRFGIEGRGNWGFRNISDEGDFTDSNAKQFTFELLGKFRFN